MVVTVSGEKGELRAELSTRRRLMGSAAREAAAAAITRGLLALPEMAHVRCVAAYLSFGTEPSTTQALTALASRGVRVLLPVTLPDRDLDWAIYDQSGPSGRDAAGLWTAVGPTQGVDAVATADVVVVPALAVGADGARLGRGGGSYDRALARVPVRTPVVALLYDGELLTDVPRAVHDRPVSVAVTPSGVHRFPRERRAARA